MDIIALTDRAINTYSPCLFLVVLCCGWVDVALPVAVDFTAATAELGCCLTAVVVDEEVVELEGVVSRFLWCAFRLNESPL